MCDNRNNLYIGSYIIKSSCSGQDNGITVRLQTQAEEPSLQMGFWLPSIPYLIALPSLILIQLMV
uniref:Uncharacterized protein n=1 Tax=Anguilla anguilla TaxID=7936 RepID=A0A0E9ST31_ANGAN